MERKRVLFLHSDNPSHTHENAPTANQEWWLHTHTGQREDSPSSARSREEERAALP